MRGHPEARSAAGPVPCVVMPRREAPKDLPLSQWQRLRWVRDDIGDILSSGESSR
jgi:hypothetical protein